MGVGGGSGRGEGVVRVERGSCVCVGRVGGIRRFRRGAGWGGGGGGIEE